MAGCSSVSNIILNYYGKKVDIYRRELDILLTNYSSPTNRLKVSVYSTTYGLGHRFHVFDEHGYHIALSPLILNLDDDMVVNCDELKNQLQIVGRMTLYHKKLREPLPISKLVAATNSGVRRGAIYESNGNIEYVSRNHSGIALTPAVFMPLELFKFIVEVIPEEMLKPIDEILNCEDIMLNFVSAFLNNNVATSVSCNARTAFSMPIIAHAGLGNSLFRRSSCIYWLDKVFDHFDTALQYYDENKKMPQCKNFSPHKSVENRFISRLKEDGVIPVMRQKIGASLGGRSSYRNIY